VDLAKHLTKTDVDAIVNIIHGWKDDRLTWEAICKSAAEVVGKKPTRQSLNTNRLIKEAYEVKKSGLKIHGPKTPTPSSLKVAAARIAKQQSEIDSLKAKNSALLEQFVKWQYNAYKYGLKEHQLNEPLPYIDRERTDKGRLDRV
jgi:hypothetical protein